VPVRGMSDGRMAWQRRSMGARLAIWFAWLVGVLVLVQCWQIMNADTIWDFVWDAPQQAGDLLGRMWPPRWSVLDRLWGPLWDTINMATLGTLLGIVLGAPVAFLAARTTTPSLLVARPIALLIIVSSRSINALIWALLLVTILGPGVLAGIIAIALRSIGFIGKLLYEALEETDAQQIEAITATGATQGQRLIFGFLPQIMPVFAGISVYRWDINIRESTILGLVGAGGIGLQLNASVSRLAWPEVTVMFAAILVTVIVSEFVSAKVRAHII
jgi:phosphonate transport system permease protein